jgi:hypothetical protein
MQSSMSLIRNLAKDFDNTEVWFERTKKTFSQIFVVERTKSVYVARLRQLLIKNGFNGHYNKLFSRNIASCALDFSKETLEWFSDQDFTRRYKVWLRAKHAKVLGKANEFENMLANVSFAPEIFDKVSVPSILGKECKIRQKFAESEARKEKFKKENLLKVKNAQDFLNYMLQPLLTYEIQSSEILLPALLFASGLRVSDIYGNAEITPYDDELLCNYAYVKSFLKTGLCYEKENLIPLLCDAKKFLFHLKSFRLRFPDSKNVSSGNNGKKNKEWCKQRVKGLCKNFTHTHQLRALYAKFAFLLFGKNEHELTFIKKVLLHESDSAASSYSNVKVNMDENTVLFVKEKKDIVQSEISFF